MSQIIRLVSWNILEGFHRPGTETMDEDRLETARRVIDALDPDVLVLNEALWCLPFRNRFVDYADLLGFPYSHGHLYDGHWGNIILSRKPIKDSSSLTIYNRGGIGATIEGGLTICTYHPHPSRYPEHKASDFALLTASQTGALALCGDFNAINPDDRPDRTLLEEGFARFSKTPSLDVARFIDGGQAVFAALTRLGLRDAMPDEARTHTMPTDLLTADKTSAMRIDHILVNEQVSVRHCEIVQNPDAETASDHRPLMADLSWR